MLELEKSRFGLDFEDDYCKVENVFMSGFHYVGHIFKSNLVSHGQ